MHTDHDVFINGISEKKKVSLSFFSKEDGAVIVRLCAPMDFGPSRRAKIPADKYHFWDYESDKGPHTLSILPNQIQSMEMVGEDFEPAEFVTWPPNWILDRDWGQFS